MIFYHGEKGRSSVAGAPNGRAASQNGGTNTYILGGTIHGSDQSTERTAAQRGAPGGSRRYRPRIQVFEGIVIAKKHGGIEETITVRRMSYGVGVEKVFPVHSPSIDKIETVRHGYVRRAKLYYLRDRVGKAAKLREKL